MAYSNVGPCRAPTVRRASRWIEAKSQRCQQHSAAATKPRWKTKFRPRQNLNKVPHIENFWLIHFPCDLIFCPSVTHFQFIIMHNVFCCLFAQMKTKSERGMKPLHRPFFFYILTISVIRVALLVMCILATKSSMKWELLSPPISFQNGRHIKGCQKPAKYLQSPYLSPHEVFEDDHASKAAACKSVWKHHCI